MILCSSKHRANISEPIEIQGEKEQRRLFRGTRCENGSSCSVYLIIYVCVDRINRQLEDRKGGLTKRFLLSNEVQSQLEHLVDADRALAVQRYTLCYACAIHLFFFFGVIHAALFSSGEACVLYFQVVFFKPPPLSGSFMVFHLLKTSIAFYSLNCSTNEPLLFVFVSALQRASGIQLSCIPINTSEQVK